MIGRASRPDCDCKVIELLNPLKNTLSAIDIVEVARNHKLVSYFCKQANVNIKRI